MKKLSMIVSVLAMSLVFVQASFASSSSSCAAEKNAMKRANSNVSAKQKTVNSLNRQITSRTNQLMSKQESYQNKILSNKSRAEGLAVKLSSCNPISGFVDLIWNNSTATSAGCMSTSFLGDILSDITSDIMCEFISPAECKRQASMRESCKRRAASVCSQIVTLRSKAEGYQKMIDRYSTIADGKLRSLNASLERAEAALQEATSAAEYAASAYDLCLAGSSSH